MVLALEQPLENLPPSRRAEHPQDIVSDSQLLLCFVSVPAELLFVFVREGDALTENALALTTRRALRRWRRGQRGLAFALPLDVARVPQPRAISTYGRFPRP